MTLGQILGSDSDWEHFNSHFLQTYLMSTLAIHFGLTVEFFFFFKCSSKGFDINTVRDPDENSKKGQTLRNVDLLNKIPCHCIGEVTFAEAQQNSIQLYIKIKFYKRLFSWYLLFCQTKMFFNRFQSIVYHHPLLPN